LETAPWVLGTVEVSRLAVAGFVHEAWLKPR